MLDTGCDRSAGHVCDPKMPLTIYPYRLSHCWVFDDERTGLKEEAFVLGASEMISRVVQAKRIPRADHGFLLTFDDQPFDHDVELDWLPAAEAARSLGSSTDLLPDYGNWYGGQVAGEEMIGWLCPALFLYFNAAPQKIYAKAEPLPAGIDPIWHIAPGDPRARRFVSAAGEIHSQAQN